MTPRPPYGMLFGHQVEIPGTKLRGIQCASRSGITPDRRIANCKRGVGELSAGFSQSTQVNEAALQIKKLFIARIGGGSSDPLQTGIGAKTIEAGKQSLIQHCLA